MPYEGRRCTRCYLGGAKVTFTGSNSQCDKCIQEVKLRGNINHQSNDTYTVVMQSKPKGDPIRYECRRRGIKYDILDQLVHAQRRVQEHRIHGSGALPKEIETPMDMAVRLLGDPDECDTKTAKTELTKLIVSYLSASANCAAWLGYYVPRYNGRGKR